VNESSESDNNEEIRINTMTKFLVKFTTLFLLLLLGTTSSSVQSQRELGTRPTDSGGPLMPEQAAFDIKSYDLDLRIDPAEQSIKGSLTAQALIVHPTAWFVLDLDPPLTVDSVALLNAAASPEPLNFERRAGKLWIAFPFTKQPGESVNVRIFYGGKPRVSPRPPWVGGFVWSKTASGQPWIGLACQSDGGDLWFPVKDHPSDEPETVALHFTVPQPLVVASNGTLKSVVKNQDGTQTYNWNVSNPINNYSINFSAAPYKTIQDKYTSISGTQVPVTFWVLPEDYDKGAALVKQTKDYLAFFEEYLGPYPFRSEKVGIVQTDYLGMEHQTIIAYGNKFKFDPDGFDWLMFHELGHEWWGNLVTASDWRDFWIHEGFQSFMDTLYLEKLRGKDAYFKGMTNRMKSLRNMQPVAPRESRTTVQMYMAGPDYVRSDGDIYGKGAVILHTLRYLIGDKPFFAALRRMSYPDPAKEKLTNGRQVRFATTDDFQRIAETASGTKLDWFFEVYLRQPKLPRLLTERKGNQLELRWETPEGLPFNMPVEVQIGETSRRYELPGGRATVQLEAEKAFVVDPQNWILKAQ
jgi:aminopeptidase N